MVEEKESDIVIERMMMIIFVVVVVVFDGDGVFVVDEAAAGRCFCRRWPLVLCVAWTDNNNVMKLVVGRLFFVVVISLRASLSLARIYDIYFLEEREVVKNEEDVVVVGQLLFCIFFLEIYYIFIIVLY